ncbi:MAG: energy transducer TonB [bacterium]|nr:energy transducer TonB [bacterium]
MKQFNLLGGCCLSLILHTGLFFFTPGFSSQYQPVADTATETELVELEIPLPPAMQPPPLQQPTAIEAASLASADVPSYDATKIVPPDISRINGAVEKMSAGLAAQFTLPALQLPAHSASEEAALSLSPTPLEVPDIVSAILEQSLLLPGVLVGKDKLVGWGEARIGDKQAPSRLGLPEPDLQQVTQVLPAILPAVVPSPASQQRFGIQGPVAKREPLSRPSSPKVHVEIESEITLKFWVRPDGVVGRIVPERKGDTVLEAAAIRYLEGWRFTPLPLYEPQVEQWGLITVRFLPN